MVSNLFLFAFTTAESRDSSNACSVRARRSLGRSLVIGADGAQSKPSPHIPKVADLPVRFPGLERRRRIHVYVSAAPYGQIVPSPRFRAQTRAAPTIA